MRVVYLTTKFPPPDTLGATATLVFQVSRELAARGVETAVICQRGLERPGSLRGRNRVELIDGVQVHRLALGRGGIMRGLYGLARSLLDESSIFHIQDVYGLSMFCLHPLGTVKARRFITLHGFQYVCKNNFLWPPASRERTAIAPGPSELCYIPSVPECHRCHERSLRGTLGLARFRLERQWYLDWIGRFNVIVPSKAAGRIQRLVSGQQVEILPNGLEDALEGLTREGARKTLGFPSEAFVVFAGGRLVPEKGYDLLLSALSDLRKKIPAVKLVVTGKGSREYASALRLKAGSMGLDVRLLPWLPKDEQFRYMAASDVVVVPTRGFEVQGMIAIEAQMLGKPVVAPCAGGLAEVVENGQNGLTFVREDWESLARSLEKLVDEKSRLRMGLRSRWTYRKRYDMKRYVDALMGIYDRHL